MPTTSSQISDRLSTAPSRGAIAAWLAIAALLVALGFVGTSTGEANPDILYDYAFAGGSVVIYGILVGVALVIASRLGPPLEAAGLKRFKWRWVGIAVGLILLVLILAQALEPLLHAGDKQGLEPSEWRPDRATAFALNALVASTVVPFAEELFFRGVGVRAFLPFGGVSAIVHHRARLRTRPRTARCAAGARALRSRFGLGAPRARTASGPECSRTASTTAPRCSSSISS